MIVMYIGVIVEQSLSNRDVLNDIKIIERNIVDADNWIETKVTVTKEQIYNISKFICDGWYMHFWSGRNVLVIFRDKVFELNYDNKDTWKEAVEYGISVGIKREQLDFPIE